MTMTWKQRQKKDKISIVELTGQRRASLSSSSSTTTKATTKIPKRVMIILIVSAVLLCFVNAVQSVSMFRDIPLNSQLESMSSKFVGNYMDHGYATTSNNKNSRAKQQQQQQEHHLQYELKPLIQEYPYYLNINSNSTSSTRTRTKFSFLVEKSDKVFKPDSFSPIVVQKHKLLFFVTHKVSSTALLQLLRRMMGYKNYIVHNDSIGLPHDPLYNGLDYLDEFPLYQANIMMTSPNWTRALFVREPKQRVLSAYMDKMLRTNASYMKPFCDPKRYKTGQPPKQDCEVIMNPELQLQNKTLIPTFESFLTNFVPNCYDVHWYPQSKRVEDKYWPYISFIGHFETIAQDTRLLLERLGIWDEYGSYGWANNGSIFEGNTVKHYTNSRNYLQKYYTPRLEQIAEELYKDDYNHSLFGYVPQKISS